MNAKRLVMTADNADKIRRSLKTQTRRVIVPQPLDIPGQQVWPNKTGGWSYWMDGTTWCDIKPSRQPGDICYIAEKHQILTVLDRQKRVVGGAYLPGKTPFAVSLTPQEWVKYKARKKPDRVNAGRFMFKSLARTFVLIKRVWAEQLQDISEEDALAEGCQKWMENSVENDSAISDYAQLWDSINKKRGFDWASNPFCWCYEFELVERPEG